MDARSAARHLRTAENAIYLAAIIFTVVLIAVAMYILANRFMEMLAVPSPESLLAAVSDMFLVVILAELLDTLMAYIETRRVLVDRIIAVALTAVARELFVYLSPLKEPYEGGGGELAVQAYFLKGLLMVSAVFGLSFALYLAGRSEKRS